MNKTMKIFGGLIFIIFLFSNMLFAEKITLACEDKQDFPTVMGNGETILADNPGMGVEAIKLLEKKLGITIEIIRMPWKRCLSEMENGKIDGVFTASFKEARKVHGRFPEKDGAVDPSRRFTSSSYAFYKLKSEKLDFSGQNYSIFTNRVGAPLGYSIVDDLKKKGLTVDESPSTKQDFEKLLKGRVQAVAALELTGDFYLLAYSDFNSKIEKMEPLIVEKPYYFMFSHQLYGKNPKLVEKIWDTIAEIREDPNFKKRLEYYLK